MVEGRSSSRGWRLLGLLDGTSLGQALVDEGKNTTSSNGGTNQLVQFFVTSNSKLQVARGDTLDTKVFGGVT